MCIPSSPRCVFSPSFSQNFSAVRKTPKTKSTYLKRTVWLRVVLTWERVSSSVKSQGAYFHACGGAKLVSMTERRRRPLACLQQQQSQAERACMTSTGMWETHRHSRLAGGRERGVFREEREVELTNHQGDTSYRGYLVGKPIRCTKR